MDHKDGSEESRRLAGRIVDGMRIEDGISRWRKIAEEVAKMCCAITGLSSRRARAYWPMINVSRDKIGHVEG
jgi:hypothetical protein